MSIHSNIMSNPIVVIKNGCRGCMNPQSTKKSCVIMHDKEIQYVDVRKNDGRKNIIFSKFDKCVIKLYFIIVQNYRSLAKLLPVRIKHFTFPLCLMLDFM